jgi:hypothetical protein
MSQVTKSGLSFLVGEGGEEESPAGDGEDSCPPVGVTGSGREIGEVNICSLNCPRRWPGTVEPLWSVAAGVIHKAAAVAGDGSGVPPAPKAMFGPPFSPSLALGVLHCCAADFSPGFGPCSSLRADPLSLPFSTIDALGVGQFVASCSNGTCRLPRSVDPRFATSSGFITRPPLGTLGVAQQEEPFPAVRRADFRRRENSCPSPVAHRFQWANDALADGGE